MVKGHSDSERGNRCRHIGYSFGLGGGKFFTCPYPLKVRHAHHKTKSRFRLSVPESFGLAARVLLYAPFRRHDSTYHGLCYHG